MKYLTIFLCLCILIMVTPIASAGNNTTENITNLTNPTNLTNLTQTNLTNLTPVVTLPTTTPEEFYGNATYSDNSPIAKGTEIVAKNQNGKIVGTFNMTVAGSYGDDYKSAPRLLVYADSSNDDISFYINNVKSTGRTMKFNSGAIRNIDIIISSNEKPTPTPTPTPVPTALPTTAVTARITVTLVPTPIPSPTPIPTPDPLLSTSKPTLAPTTTITAKPVVPIATDATPKFLGVLLISIAICIIGAIVTYYILTKKMKRDDEEEINL